MSTDLWREHNGWILDRLADDLAEILGRTAQDVREHGIFDHEYPAEKVRVYFGGDPEECESVCEFRYAICVLSRRNKTIAIFSNHAGYFLFSYGCAVSILPMNEEAEERFIFRQRDW